MNYLNEFIFIVLLSLNGCLAWDSEQLEVFDTFDEVKENFYDLMNISKDANAQQIKSSFRSLSLKLHPDKNQDEDTSEKFRNLVSVYEILRNPVKRKYYDEVLINGLPNWRSAVYYYRFVRKMGIAEVCTILFVIISIGQYLVNWGSYFEKKFTWEIKKQKRKKSKKWDKSDEKNEIFEIPKPSLMNTLPIQIPRWVWYIISCIPSFFISINSYLTDQIKELQRAKTVQGEMCVPVRIKTLRKRNRYVVPEGSTFETTSNTKDSSESASVQPQVSGGLWTDDDLSELIRLIKKYPGGSTARWETIAEALNRSVPEVTFMAHKVKENAYRLPSEQTEDLAQPPKVKQKTKKELDSSDDVKNWSQTEQRALEDALAKFPKRCSDRWDRISENVPNKTKEECMIRYRYLAETLRKQKGETGSDT